MLRRLLDALTARPPLGPAVVVAPIQVICGDCGDPDGHEIAPVTFLAVGPRGTCCEVCGGTNYVVRSGLRRPALVDTEAV